MDKISLNKTVKEKNQYQKVIDVSFTQLVPAPQVDTTPTKEEQISNFFSQYEELFYDIPKEGESRSHTYLIKQSSDYVNSQLIDEDVQALLDEISSLREENLELQRQLLNPNP